MLRTRLYGLKTHPRLVAAVLVIGAALAVRLVFLLAGWPETDSDEGTMGLEALHILTQGARPIYLYGQNYMGVAEAYLGAFMYRLFGVSLLSLRLGMLLLFGMFLVALYLLGRLLYGHGVALASIALLALGAHQVMRPELIAVGGVAETLVSGTLLFLVASWLAITAAETPVGWSWRRSALYALWGVAAGFGLWSHLLIVPFVVASFALLALFCRRELLAPAGLLLVAGTIVGGWPLILYNLHAPADQNSLAVFWQIHQYKYPSAPSGVLLPLTELAGTLFLSLPLATGMNETCPLQVFPGYGHWQAATPFCIVLNGGWSVGVLALLTLATFLAARTLWLPLRAARQAEQSRPPAIPAALARDTARLLLLAVAWLTILAYVDSQTAAVRPWSGRYLMGWLVVTPALLSPLVEPLIAAWHLRGKLDLRVVSWRIGALSLILAVWLWGTALDVAAVPAVAAQTRQDAAVLRELRALGVSDVYSGYWQCDRLIFASDERVTCAVLSDDLGAGLNRYAPYWSAVKGDPHASFLFPDGSAFAAAFVRQHPNWQSHYSKHQLDGYILYVPAS